MAAKNPKTCIACGMPLESAEDYPLGDETKKYCKYCAHSDGTMQSYDEKLAAMTQFIQDVQGVDETAAREYARKLMADLPAWRRETSKN